MNRIHQILQIIRSRGWASTVLMLAVPVGTFLATAIFPLSAFARQALVGITLVWLYVGLFEYFGLMSA